MKNAHVKTSFSECLKSTVFKIWKMKHDCILFLTNLSSVFLIFWLNFSTVSYKAVKSERNC